MAAHSCTANTWLNDAGNFQLYLPGPSTLHWNLFVPKNNLWLFFRPRRHVSLCSHSRCASSTTKRSANMADPSSPVTSERRCCCKSSHNGHREALVVDLCHIGKSLALLNNTRTWSGRNPMAKYTAFSMPCLANGPVGSILRTNQSSSCRHIIAWRRGELYQHESIGLSAA